MLADVSPTERNSWSVRGAYVNSTMMGINSAEAIVRFWWFGLKMRGGDDGSNCLSDGEEGEFDISRKSCV